MTGLGILDNDLLIVDRSLPIVDGNIVIVIIDSKFTVKQFFHSKGGCILKAANPAYSDIIIDSEDINIKQFNIQRAGKETNLFFK